MPQRVASCWWSVPPSWDIPTTPIGCTSFKSRIDAATGRGCLMLKILLFRAGSTDYDRQGRVQGTLDLPLSEDGKRQVNAAVGELGHQAVDAPLHEPLPGPASETAEVIGDALQVKVRALEKLQNLDQGLWQGMLIDDVKKKQTQAVSPLAGRTGERLPP